MNKEESVTSDASLHGVMNAVRRLVRGMRATTHLLQLVTENLNFLLVLVFLLRVLLEQTDRRLRVTHCSPKQTLLFSVVGVH